MSPFEYLTGNPQYDRLVFREAAFVNLWQSHIEARGFQVQTVNLPDDTPAQIHIESRQLQIDPDRTTYLSFLHERHHMRQFVRLERQGYSLVTALTTTTGQPTKIRNWLELGAYQYMENLGNHHSFSRAFMIYVREMQWEWWGKSLRNKYNRSASIRNKFDRIWK